MAETATASKAAATNDRLLAGGLLAGSLLVVVVAIIILVASGAFPAFSSRISGTLAAVGPHADTFRLLIFLFTITWIVQLLGVALLTRLLLGVVNDPLAVLGFVLVLVAVILAVVNTTFRMTVEVWAAEQGIIGRTPTFYAPLSGWVRSFFGIAYVAHLIGIACCGLAMVRANLPSRAIGWVAVGWSVTWLGGRFVGVGAPAIPLLMPAVIGVALVSSSFERAIGVGAREKPARASGERR